MYVWLVCVFVVCKCALTNSMCMQQICIDCDPSFWKVLQDEKKGTFKIYSYILVHNKMRVIYDTYYNILIISHSMEFKQGGNLVSICITLQSWLLNTYDPYIATVAKYIAICAVYIRLINM